MLPSVYLEVPDLADQAWRRPLPEPPVAPDRAQAEAELAALWEAVLGTGPVGRDESFFRRGGSLRRGAAMIARAAEAGIAIHPRQLLAAPTIARLATPREGPAPPPAQHGAWPERLRVRLDDAGRVVASSLRPGEHS